MQAAVRLVLIASLALASVSGADLSGRAERGAKKNPPSRAAPPQPIPSVITVKRGTVAEIPLRIYGTRTYTLTYLLRSAPEHGRLTAWQQIDQQSALARYEPPSDLAVTQDRFFFAVKSSEGVSARAEVRISIVDEPARIVAAAELEFPATLSGEKSVRELEVSNHGGGIAEGELLVPAPWRIVERARYRLASGERRRFRLEFAPAEARTYTGELRFSSQPDRLTELRGQAHPALEILPPRLELRRDSREPARTGVFEIANHTNVDQVATFTAAARLKLPESLVVAPASRGAVVVRTGPDDLAALEEIVQVSAGTHSAQCAVHAAAIGAILRIEPEPLRFGRLPAGTPGRLGFEIINIGGAPAALQWHVPPPLELDSGAPQRLEPGERGRGVLRLAGAAAGRFHSAFTVQGAPEVLRVLVEAEVSARSEVKSRRPSRQNSPANQSPAMISQTAVAEPAADPRDPDPAELAAVPGPTIAEITPTRCVVEWPISLSGAPRFCAMARHLDLDERRKLRVTWKQYAGFSTQPVADRVQGTFTNLQPGTVYSVRIHAALPDGEPGNALFQFPIFTPAVPASKITWRGSLLVGGAVLVAASLLWQWRQRRNGRL